MTDEQIRYNLKNQSESIQNDLMCILDGLDYDILDRACDVVVSRIAILESLLCNNKT